MSKRLAVVTGGIGGLGTEICRHLVADGRNVIAVTTALLTRAGIEVFNEREIARLNAALRAAEGDDAQ